MRSTFICELEPGEGRVAADLQATDAVIRSGTSSYRRATTSRRQPPWWLRKGGAYGSWVADDPIREVQTSWWRHRAKSVGAHRRQVVGHPTCSRLACGIGVEAHRDL